MPLAGPGNDPTEQSDVQFRGDNVPDIGLRRGNLLDLVRIAETETKGNLFALLDGYFQRSMIKPRDMDDAVVWQGGRADPNINPVVHAFTDKFALVGTLMAADVLDLPFLAVPMMAQYRHDQKLAPLKWFGNMAQTAIKWSTAGDALVDEGGQLVVVSGKSGNAKLRTDAGVYCNVRPYGNITAIRCMPCLPYSQDRKAFRVDAESGIIHSEMNTPGVQMAYAGRRFLQMVHESGRIGRVAFKPTQAMEDGINAGLLRWLMRDTNFELVKRYSVDAHDEHREYINRIVALLPHDFKDGMEDWGGEIHEHIADTNYGILLHDIIAKRPVIILTTDLDGDRLTDLMADAPGALCKMAEAVLEHCGIKKNVAELWRELGHTTTDGRDMTSVMYRMTGQPIFEQTLGSADAMLQRILDGDETVGGTKAPYNPRIHFVLIREAYLAANPENPRLRRYLDDALATFDYVYARERPLFLEGYNALKDSIQPWEPE
ncbi:MAG: hypothetical protein KDD42_01135 [Bdellovibrionales bacterium]|nr:hypothetical protein [Bdellovibrionales bacterium]